MKIVLYTYYGDMIIKVIIYILNTFQVEEEVAYNLLKHLMFNMGCRQQYRSDLIGLQVSK